jgi:hypothetical protein
MRKGTHHTIETKERMKKQSKKKGKTYSNKPLISFPVKVKKDIRIKMSEKAFSLLKHDIILFEEFKTCYGEFRGIIHKQLPNPKNPIFFDIDGNPFLYKRIYDPDFMCERIAGDKGCYLMTEIKYKIDEAFIVSDRIEWDRLLKESKSEKCYEKNFLEL